MDKPVAQVQVSEDYYPYVLWSEEINPVELDQQYLYTASQVEALQKDVNELRELFNLQSHRAMEFAGEAARLRREREWVALTDEEIQKTLEAAGFDTWFSYRYAARAIEDKLREKNNG